MVPTASGPASATVGLVGDQFHININPSFEISEGIPGPGAGKIETPGSKDIYSFAVTEGQSIFVQAISLEATKDTLPMEIDDSNGKTVKSCMINNMGVAFTLDFYSCDTVKFTRVGTYSLIVGSDTDSIIGTDMECSQSR